VAELGLRTTVGDTVRGTADVFPEVCVPGTDRLRISVLATWADIVSGAVAGLAVEPRIPLTLDLEVQVSEPAALGTVVDAEARAVKVGRTVVVCETRFCDHRTGAPLAVALASFIRSPNPEHVFADGFPSLTGSHGRLTVPFAERAECAVASPGVVVVPRKPDGLNASGAMQGGIVALAAEEAARSLSPAPAGIEALNLRYLRPVTVGPARAVATGHEHFALVHVTDTGTGKLAAIATART